MIIHLSSNSVSSTSIPPNRDGSTRVVRESLWGAWMAHVKMLESGLALDTKDALKVDPLAQSSQLWLWVQPVMSSGGHIVGAPVPTTSQDEAVRMGARVLHGLLTGHKYICSKPEYALPILYVLAHGLNDNNRKQSFTHRLLNVIGYGKEALVDEDYGMEYKERYLQHHCHYTNVAEYLQTVTMYEHGKEALLFAPSWKEIKRTLGCTNKCARYIRRVMLTYFPQKCVKMRVQTLRHECFSPIDIRSNPVASFVLQCWNQRGSSISCHLPKQPPPIVKEILKESGFGNGEMVPSDDFYRIELKNAIKRKFEAFQSCILLLHGPLSSPNSWSDTLSKFASAINPRIDEYNKLFPDDKLMHATSFVPADLAPEMHRRTGVDTGYFFMGRGWIYCYSAVWRRDAVEACVRSLLPPSQVTALIGFENQLSRHVSAGLAYTGGTSLLMGLNSAGISEELFTKFLRQYYWSGAFLTINLELLGR